jgi:hypothetical protein
MEWWNDGALEYWSSGVLEYWMMEERNNCHKDSRKFS